MESEQEVERQTHKVELEAHLELGGRVTGDLGLVRGAESWQFFAFVFAALTMLEFAMIQEIFPPGLLRTCYYLAAFGLTGFVTLGWSTGKATLIKVLDAIKRE